MQGTEFITRHEKMVHGLANRLRRELSLRGDLDDLIAFGFGGLLEARHRFDPGRGVQFQTFAYHRVRGALLDGVRKMSQPPPRAPQRFPAAAGTTPTAAPTALAKALPPHHARLHTAPRGRNVLRDFHRIMPQKFNNKTNGVTPRRFMMLGNPRLSELITGAIGETWLTNLEELRKLEPFVDDPGFREDWSIMVILVGSGVFQAVNDVVTQVTVSKEKMWWNFFIHIVWGTIVLGVSYFLFPSYGV